MRKILSLNDETLKQYFSQNIPMPVAVAIVVPAPRHIKQCTIFVRQCSSSQISLLDFNHRTKSVAKAIPANNEPIVNPVANALQFLDQQCLLLSPICLGL